MDLSAFKSPAAGVLLPIEGFDPRFDERYAHAAFIPAPLPATVPLDEATYSLVTDAALALGRLDMAAKNLPNPLLVARPALRREAVSTSALEGTYAAFTEVLEADVVASAKRPANVSEVLNYVAAAEHGLAVIRDRPISMNMIADLQKQIVRGTRGDTYDSGRLRERQVYIGPDGCRIGEARFVPCPPGDRLIEGVSLWEKWINAEDNIPLLVKVALGHYQFESLHPFSDGNGRLGRLVATLQLVYNGALTYPLLNLSPWIEPRRTEYQDLLLRVSQTGQFDDWVRFFCEAVRAQSADAVVRIDRLKTARDEMTATIKAAGAKGTSLEIVDDLLGYPVITAKTAAALHNVSYQAANQAISRLVGLGILREATGRSYGRVFMCDAVIREIERP